MTDALYTPEEVKQMLWQIFKDSAIDIKFKGQLEGYYLFNVIPDLIHGWGPVNKATEEISKNNLFDITERQDTTFDIWFESSANGMQSNYLDNKEHLTEKKQLTESMIKDLNIERPSRMVRPNIIGMTKSATAYWRDLYIQDEAEGILQDKYGKERGTKTFQGLIDSYRGGSFYQAVTQVVIEKYKMYNELGIRPEGDYFNRSYFSLWKEWMALKNKKFSHLLPSNKTVASVVSATTPKAQPVVQQAPVSKPQTFKPASTNSKVNIGREYDAKDEMRIRDIVSKAAGSRSKIIQLTTTMANKITDKDKALRRARAAEEDNYHEIANIFYKRYIALK